MSIKKYTKGITHGGIFHADDVFSTALLKIIYPNILIKRVNTIPQNIDNSTIVYDIGLGNFDHHQPDALFRKNGVKYSSFGLLWQKYGKYLIGENWECFDNGYVLPIDIQDNGGELNPLSNAINAFNPSWNEDKSTDESFDEAVSIAMIILKKLFNKYKLEQFASEHISKIMKEFGNSPIIILDKFVPWKKEVCESENALYVIYPSMRGCYNAQAVPTEYGKKTCRLPFPETWLRNSPEALTFIHPERYLISADKIDSAEMLCQLSISQSKVCKFTTTYIPQIESEQTE